jgi:hypothetical protein
MVITRTKPNASGSQAPSGIFSRLEEMNTRSTTARGATSSSVRARLHFHIIRRTTKASRVSTNIEPVTAMP